MAQGPRRLEQPGEECMTRHMVLLSSDSAPVLEARTEVSNNFKSHFPISCSCAGACPDWVTS